MERSNVVNRRVAEKGWCDMTAIEIEIERAARERATLAAEKELLAWDAERTAMARAARAAANRMARRDGRAT